MESLSGAKQHLQNMRPYLEFSQGIISLGFDPAAVEFGRRRGAYIVQPELDPLLVADQCDRKFVGVDKVFLAYLDGRPAFIGGFRTLLPADSDDARKGKNHGTGPTIWAEIVGNASRFLA